MRCYISGRGFHLSFCTFGYYENKIINTVVACFLNSSSAGNLEETNFWWKKFSQAAVWLQNSCENFHSYQEISSIFWYMLEHWGPKWTAKWCLVGLPTMVPVGVTTGVNILCVMSSIIKIFVVDLQSIYVSCNVTILYQYCISISTVPCVAWTVYKLSRLQVTLLTNTHIGKCCKLVCS